VYLCRGQGMCVKIKVMVRNKRELEMVK
jgi:hypothetical protein